jgi:D-galactose 1-dehydrogenase
MPEPVAVTGAELFFPANAEAPIAANLKLACGGRTGGFEVETDWRPIERDIWEISVETEDGTNLKLSSGGVRLDVNGKIAAEKKPAEYEAIYSLFDELLREGRGHVDAAPFRLVADAFMVGKRTEVEAFVE